MISFLYFFLLLILNRERHHHQQFILGQQQVETPMGIDTGEVQALKNIMQQSFYVPSCQFLGANRIPK